MALAGCTTSELNLREWWGMLDTWGRWRCHIRRFGHGMWRYVLSNQSHRCMPLMSGGGNWVESAYLRFPGQRGDPVEVSSMISSLDLWNSLYTSSKWWFTKRNCARNEFVESDDSVSSSKWLGVGRQGAMELHSIVGPISLDCSLVDKWVSMTLGCWRTRGGSCSPVKRVGWAAGTGCKCGATCLASWGMRGMIVCIILANAWT